MVTKKFKLKMKVLVISFISILAIEINAFAKESKKGEITVLPGTSVEAVLLTGVIAPVNKDSSSTRVVILKTTGYALMPSGEKISMDGSFLIGEATGDYASKRVFVRLRTLSYVSFTGDHQVVEAHGFVFNKGMPGIEGNIIGNDASTIGKTVAFSLLDSVTRVLEQGSGIAQQVLPISGTTTASTTTPSVTGNNSFSKMADRYIALLKDLSPEIVVNNGIKCEVVFTEPFKFVTSSVIR